MTIDTTAKKESENSILRSSNAEVHRLQVVIDSDLYKELLNIQRETKAVSVADVVRKAITLLRWFLLKRREGYQILLQRPNEPDSVTEVEFL